MARPFNVELVRNQREVQNQYRHIENLLMELLSMLRWTPWFTMIDALENAHEPQPPIDDVAAVQNRLNEHFQRGNVGQDRLPMPDLIPANNAEDLIRTMRARRVGEPAAPAAGPMNAARAPAPIVEARARAPIAEVRARAPIAEARARAPIAEARARAPIAEARAHAPNVAAPAVPIHIAAAPTPPPDVVAHAPAAVAQNPVPDVVSDAKDIVLQVEITPNRFCSGRRFKLVMVSNSSVDDNNAAAPLVLRRRSMFSGFMKTINSSMLTAAFVIIGLKIFAKK